MSLLLEIRRRMRHVLGPLIGACVVGYFAYHTIQGERGLISWIHLNQQIKAAKATLAQTEDERLMLERQVGLLRSENLDPDLLEERSRAVLNMARDDEVVILTGPRDRKQTVTEKAGHRN